MGWESVDCSTHLAMHNNRHTQYYIYLRADAELVLIVLHPKPIHQKLFHYPQIDTVQVINNKTLCHVERRVHHEYRCTLDSANLWNQTCLLSMARIIYIATQNISSSYTDRFLSSDSLLGIIKNGFMCPQFSRSRYPVAYHWCVHPGCAGILTQ